MTAWRPLSKRGQPDPRLDEPTEGLPGYLAGPVFDWVVGRFEGAEQPKLDALQLAFQLEEPLNRASFRHSLDDLLDRMAEDDEFALDVLDWMLHFARGFRGQYEGLEDGPDRLDGILRLGGSVWEVSEGDEYGEYRLTRRAVGPIREALDDLPASSRAHQHMVTSWNRLSGRDPDESAAYREAVRAVESAAKSVILPDDDRATLGKMIHAMKDKPEKWETTLGSVDDLRRQMEAVWKGQGDRHGTDDDSVPVKVSPGAADAAFAMCLDLVRLFTGGHVRSKEG